ncbi:aminotransferase class V [Candidatus Bathyarchaeota archaeon ex4484_40]|nr:MAG: aminotransferase class V [Candidatus Bathyarchaeota archaeon ex4484_40]
MSRSTLDHNRWEPHDYPYLRFAVEFYREYRANIARGVHRLSQRASEEYESSRRKVAKFINASAPFEVVMTRNATEGINIIANGLNWRRGEKIVTSLIEHHSNFIVWLRVRDRYGVDVDVVKPSKPLEDGLFEVSDFEKVIDDRTKLVAVTQISNVLGLLMPVKEIADIAHEHGAFLLVDGAQSVPHIRVDVQRLNCDFLAFSGHKMCAPTGSGALYIREELLDEVKPLCIGGGTIADVGLDFYELSEDVSRFEAGTPAIADVIGFGAAVDYLERIGMENIERHEAKLTERIHEGLREIPKVEVYGPEPKYRVGITSFNVEGLNHHDVALALDASSRIIVRSGHHCALPLMKELIRRPGTVRASTYLYNTLEEAERLISAVEEITQKMA